MSFAIQENHLDITLILPDVPELRQRLTEKLDEYNSRVEAYKKKYEVKKLGIVFDRDSNMLDAIYKREIVKALLQSGKVEIREVHDRLFEEFNGYVSEDIFTNAVCVINDYIKNGGKYTLGGSGFFTDEMFKGLLKRSAVLEYPESASKQARLQEKYFEYVGRNADYEQHADATIDRAAMKRNGYKMKILAMLRGKHRVAVEDIARNLLKEEGEVFDKIEFYNALSQIQLLLKRLVMV